MDEKMSELFAQLHSVYKFDPEWSKIHTPKFFRLAKGIENARSSEEVEFLISGASSAEELERIIESYRGPSAPYRDDQSGTVPPSTRNSRNLSGVFRRDVAPGGNRPAYAKRDGGNEKTIESSSRHVRQLESRGSANTLTPAASLTQVPARDGDASAQATNLSRQSAQTANDGTGRELYTEEEIAAAKKLVEGWLGDSVIVEFLAHFGDNSSGSWTPTAMRSIIRLALNGDIMGAAAHENMHEFFNLLRKAGDKETQDIIVRHYRC